MKRLFSNVDRNKTNKLSLRNINQLIMFSKSWHVFCAEIILGKSWYIHFGLEYEYWRPEIVPFKRKMFAIEKTIIII